MNGYIVSFKYLSMPFRCIGRFKKKLSRFFLVGILSVNDIDQIRKTNFAGPVVIIFQDKKF